MADLDFTGDGVDANPIDINDATFDGGKTSGYSLTIKSSTTTGLLIIDGGTIQNVTINTQSTYSSNEGVLINYDSGSAQYGTITNIYVDGISSTYPSISTGGGGITCRNFGSASNTSNISECEVIIGNLSGSYNNTCGGITGHRNSKYVISDCKVSTSNSPMTGTYYGGIAGGDPQNGVTISDCWTNVPIGNTRGGGIIQGMEASGTPYGDITIERCISTGDLISSGTTNGGIVAHITGNGTYLIQNCYYTGSSTASGSGNNIGGIIGFSNVTGSSLNITNCYAMGTKNTSGGGMIYGYGTPTTVTLTGCLIRTDESFGRGVSNDSESQQHTDGGNNEARFNPADNSTWPALGTGWSTSIWSPGASDGEYPILQPFTESPWNMSSYNGTPALSGNGGAGGDPHIVPIYGEKYDLPTDENTYLLLDTKDKDNKLIIKGKCIMKGDESFFKYIKIIDDKETTIVDCKDLRCKKFTNYDDLNNGILPNAPVPRKYKYQRGRKAFSWKRNKLLKTSFIEIDKPDLGVNISIYSRQATVNLKGPNKLLDKSTGALVREYIEIVDF